ncbi:hypothetical protein BT96DRAFT_940745 [Gymnopus androsaceus JB14]|uniref:F-box domain-containing protein n=1 Tax=Gymnopus androsaceus JB14 TaxID=1447944 RepID=A0A6A4HLL1_9AGAR|nr:hypothetical protein BT96DRAFT_940745 [Gymnopus androsaceus JB14]
MNALILNAAGEQFQEILHAVSRAPLEKLSITIHTRPLKAPPPLVWISEEFPGVTDLTIIPVFTLNDEVLRFLASSKHLSRLLFTPDFRAEKEGQFPTDISLSNLNQLDNLSLKIGCSEVLLNWFLSSSWTPRLHTLALTKSHYYHKGCGPITQLNLLLSLTRDTLEHLAIDIEYRNEPHDKDEHPDGLRKLRSFRVVIHDIEAVCDALETVDSSVDLERIEIQKVHWRSLQIMFHTEVHCPKDKPWLRLNRLMKQAKFRQMKVLDIHVPPSYGDEQLSMIRDYLMDCDSKEILGLQFLPD